jgi:hypothetical protein
MTDSKSPIVERLQTEVNISSGTVSPLRLEAADTIEELVAMLAKVRERFEWGGHEGEQKGCPTCDLFNEVAALLAKVGAQ